MLLRKARGYKSCLEFGPGISTLALIEAGVERIVTCEHDPEWLERAKEQFKPFPQVTVIPYLDEPIATADLGSERFDFAFVDSPKGYNPRPNLPKGGRKVHPGQEDCSRLNTCLLALEHTDIAYLHDAKRPLERGTLGRLNALGFKITMLNLSVGGFARIERAKG